MSAPVEQQRHRPELRASVMGPAHWQCVCGYRAEGDVSPRQARKLVMQHATAANGEIRGRETELPRVGDIAHHNGGVLDPRWVASVSHDGRQVKLALRPGIDTGWLPAANYTFQPGIR